MLIKAHTEIVIRNEPDAIWEYAYNPENWTASNPQEHRGLRFFNSSNRPETGVEFYQKEFIAGFFADLRGLILWAERPHVCVWTGVATYKILSGLLRPKIPEGGVVRIEKSDNGVVLSHDVFMDFPESPWGKIMLWTFTKVFNGDQAVYDHTYRELLYFKAQLERPVQGKG